MLAIDGLRRVGKAGVAAGPIAGQSGAVVPAARVLGRVTADGAGIADLRARDLGGSVRQQAEFGPDRRMALDFGERRQRTDLDAVCGLANAFHLGNAGKIDDGLRLLGALLEPRQAVVAARHLPAILAVAVEQRESIPELCRL